MNILPPELYTYSPARYSSDIDYRQAIDLETFGERHQRLRSLFITDYPYETDTSTTN